MLRPGILCNTRALKEAVDRVIHAVSKRSTLPILGNIALIAQEEQHVLIVRATNLEIAIEEIIPAKVQLDQDITVNAVHLQKELKAIPSSSLPVELTILEAKEGIFLSVRFGDGVGRLKGIVIDEFPAVPTIKHEEIGPHDTVVITARSLRTMIKRVTPSCADDESRPVFTGVNMERDTSNQTLTWVGADAFRLAVDTTRSGLVRTDRRAILPDMLIPRTTLMTLGELLGKNPKDVVRILIEEKRHTVHFLSEGWRLTSRTIEGMFPNFRQIIPPHDQFTTTVRIPVNLMIRVYTILLEYSKESSNIGIITTGTDPETHSRFVRFYAGDSDHQREKEFTYYETGSIVIDGLDQAIAIKTTYILDILKVLEAEKKDDLIFSFISPTKPFAITLPRADDQGFIQVIMPMHSNGRDGNMLHGTMRALTEAAEEEAAEEEGEVSVPS